MKNSVNIYPNGSKNSTIEHSDSTKKNLAICFSGGGSRALTCAWGQMIGLKELKLIDNARYLSSVSGGTWASSIYTFLPENISDDELLGCYQAPEKLSLSDGENSFNINSLGKYHLGQVPLGMEHLELAKKGALFLMKNSYNHENYRWLWASLVGELVLEPYGLQSRGKQSWSSSKHFSLSLEYAKNNFSSNAPSIDDFYFVRPNRPFIVMNNNIMIKDEKSVVELPNQVTPICAGAKGQTPSGFVGGGLVESYGYSSTLEQKFATSSPVDIKISQPYSLIDIVSTSSAFFAEQIADIIKGYMKDPEKKRELIHHIHTNLKDEDKESLLERAKERLFDILEMPHIIEAHLEELVAEDLKSSSNIIPKYNYWQVGEKSNNQEMYYTDGGTLENSGILGMLAQTDTGDNTQEEISLVSFVNGYTPLEKIDGNIIAASQLAPLFGIKFDVDTGEYRPFSDSEKNSENEDFIDESLIQIFENRDNQFDNLVKGVYASSCGASSVDEVDDAKVNTQPAFYEIELQTVENALAHITARRKVKVLYIQNAKILNWQNKITDEVLRDEITNGQDSIDPFEDFSGFPYYSTTSKIGLEPKESNALSQMWAWAIADDASPLKKKLEAFM